MKACLCQVMDTWPNNQWSKTQFEELVLRMFEQAQGDAEKVQSPLTGMTNAQMRNLVIYNICEQFAPAGNA